MDDIKVLCTHLNSIALYSRNLDIIKTLGYLPIQKVYVFSDIEKEDTDFFIFSFFHDSDLKYEWLQIYIQIDCRIQQQISEWAFHEKTCYGCTFLIETNDTRLWRYNKQKMFNLLKVIEPIDNETTGSLYALCLLFIMFLLLIMSLFIIK